MLVAGAGLAATVSAQEPTATSTAGEPSGGAGFVARVAEKLGVTVEQFREAIKAAALEAVDDALASGRITQEQADRARERIESGKGLRRFFDRLEERRERRHDVVRRGIIESAAGALNMSAEELRAELKAGLSLAEVAEQQGVSADDLKSRITTDAQSKLAQAVENGRLTQERADELLARLTERLDDIINASKEPPAS